MLIGRSQPDTVPLAITHSTWAARGLRATRRPELHEHFLRAAMLLERPDEFGGEDVRLLRQVLGAEPVGHADGFMGLREESADFIGHVLLRGVQCVTRRGVQILLSGADVGVDAGLRAGFFFQRKLR